MEPVSFRHQFDNQFHQQNNLSETRPSFNANPCGNGIEKIGIASHHMVSQLQPSLLDKNLPVDEAYKPIDNVRAQTDTHKSLLPRKSCSTDAEKSLLGSNLQEIIKFLSANHGLPMKTPLEMGTPEYLRLVEILHQSSVQPNGFPDQLNGRGSSQEEFSGGSEQNGSNSKIGGTKTPSVERASFAPSVSTEQDEASRTMHNEGQPGPGTNYFGNKLESTNGGSHHEGTIKGKDITVAPSIHKPKLASTEDESSICSDNLEKMHGHDQKNDSFLGPPKTEVKKLPSERATRVATEKLWEGSLQLSSSVTLKAVAFFKSGEKLLGNNWPEFIEVKGKVRLEAFEKYVQDLPRSRNRGLMVISVCWKEGSSELGLTGMKEIAKGYKKSSRVGFAQLLSGIDLYLCPRSDPIITILAKYGFFKGMAVLDDKPDSMIGCVVWRKNRPLNTVGNTSDSKSSPNSTQPQNLPSGLSIKQVPENKLSPEKLPPESNQHDEPVTLPLATNSESSKNLASVEVDRNGGNSSSSSSPSQNPVISDSCNLVRKRPFEDDDLPEFDFGIACGKSTLVNSAVSRNNGLALAAVNGQNLDGSRLTQLPSVVKTVEMKTSNGSVEQPSKKSKLFDDDDDMPEWCPPELHNQMPPTSNFQTLPPCPPRPPPIPPPPRADMRPSFSYQPFRPAISSPPTSFMGAPPPPQSQPQPQLLPPSSSGRFNPNQGLWHRPGSSNVNSSFPSSNRRRPQR
ncbi:hypothetical protein L6452_21818 [Arctium lappa]|uniref:Uncharacterized protein n=1 Tax=Arctium lappa TaxID=4217 RepID=A0ACB9AZS3_ARCLA|nr:hypothetical protein L6452_21818 [Arctium lappa]